MDSDRFDDEGACADDVNKNSAEITEENNDDTHNLDPSKFLSASDLCSARRNMGKNHPKEDNVELKGPKMYYPDDNPSSDEIVDRTLSDRKKSLELQRTAKIRECVKAVWNEELKVAVVPFLKGKASQHMGVNMKGNCALSPQEAIFLLEKGLIEIEHNKVPLSVEEAYALMLQGRLSVEKYEVYSFLSQQGFIVVHHQSRIGPKYEQLINLEKGKHRKRKNEVGPNGAPSSPKRLTFAGLLGSTIENISSASSLSSNDMVVDVCDTPGELSNDVAVDVGDTQEELLNDVAVDVADGPGELSNDVAVDNYEAPRELLNDAIADVSDTPVELSNDRAVDVYDVPGEMSESQGNGENVNKDLPAESSSYPDSIDRNKNSGKEVTAGLQDVAHDEVASKNSLSAEDNRKSDKDQSNTFEEMVLDITNEGNNMDVEKSDTNEVIIEDEPEFNKSDNDSLDVNVNESSSEYSEKDDDDDDDVDEDDESKDISEVHAETNEIESLDVNSSSSGPNIVNSDLGSESSKHSKSIDDDITLVEVKKKEKKPLAVIDLSSDDDSDSDHPESKTVDEASDKKADEESDDDIQVLKVFPVPGSNNQTSTRNESCVKTESTKLKIPLTSVITKSTYKPQMKFPDLCKKDIMCLPRPPSNLLPNNVQPAKEVYVINHKNTLQKGSGRVWKSFKDMQEYQRERRRERQQSSSHSFRPGSGLRDYKSPHDSLANQNLPFNTPENSRDHGSQNFPMLPRINTPPQFPVNPERNNVTLLPTPSAFSPAGHLPFDNIHNLQNLSATNPAAFVNEIQKTVYSVASSMISTMLGQHLNLPARSSPVFSETFVGFNSHSQFSNTTTTPGSMFMNPSMRFPLNHSYPGDLYPASMNNPYGTDNNWAPMQPSFQPRSFPPHRGPLFPCTYRNVRKKRDWRDVKAAVAGTSNMSDSSSDIEEVPINLNQFLSSNDMKPLVNPGSVLPFSDVQKSLKNTQKANLCDTKCILDRYLPSTSTIEISFDVYLPNSNYRRSAPTPPNYRIIVMKSSDLIPRFSEIISLKKNWNDKASLQIAIVDHKDISFYNFSSVEVPDMPPSED